MLGVGRPPTNGRPARGAASSRHPRQSSGAYASVFDADQIRTFREAFSFMDTDNDGLISASDLRSILASLGQTPSQEHINNLLNCKPSTGDPTLSVPSSNDRSGAINFTMFVTMMAEHMSELDTENELLNAFSCFDEEDKGKISTDELRKWLSEFGDRMSQDEIDRLLSPPFTDRARKTFDYRLFCHTLRVTDTDDSGLDLGM